MYDLNINVLGRWFSQYSIKIFPWFKDESFAPGLAVAICLFALFIIAEFILIRYVPAWIQLGRCARRLKKFQSWEEFSKEFHEFDTFVGKKVKVLRYSWQEFTKTVIPGDEGEKRPVWITVRPSTFLNLPDVEQSIGLKRFLGWANIFVGVGLLLTFLGLVAALFFAASAIRDAAGTENGTQQAMQQALVQLLNTATFKFWTSIAGLSCSILITLLHKFLSVQINRLFGLICKRIERLTHTVTPEWLAHRQVQALQEQSDQLKSFNDQLAFTLGQALEKALQQAMPNLMSSAMSPVVERLDHLNQNNGPTFEDALNKAMPPVMEAAMAPLADRIGNMAENISNMNQSALHSLTEEFGNVVTANAGTELRTLASTLEQVRETLAATSRQVTGSGGEMSRQLSEATQELRSVMSSLVGGIERLSQGVDTDLARTQEALKAQLSSVGQNLDALANGIKTSISEMGGQLTTTSRQAADVFNEQIASAVKRIEAAAENGASSLEALVGSMRSAAEDAAGSLANETAGSARSLQESVEKMTMSMEQAMRRLEAGASESSEKLSSRLLESVGELQESTRKNAALINDAVEAIVGVSDIARKDVDLAVKRVSTDLDVKGQEAAGKLVNGTSQVIRELSSTIDGLKAGVGGMISSMAEVDNRLAGHTLSLKGLNESTKSTADVMAMTATSLKEATVPLANAQQALSRVTDSLKQAVEKVFERMPSIQQELGRLSQETSVTLNRLQSIWAQYEKRFGDVDVSLGKTVETIVKNLHGNAVSFSEYVKKVDSNLAETVNLFAGNIEELTHTAQELRKATETLGRSGR